jgi:hypothetical protein
MPKADFYWYVGLIDRLQDIRKTQEQTDVA